MYRRSRATRSQRRRLQKKSSPVLLARRLKKRFQRKALVKPIAIPSISPPPPLIPIVDTDPPNAQEDVYYSRGETEHTVCHRCRYKFVDADYEKDYWCFRDPASGLLRYWCDLCVMRHSTSSWDPSWYYPADYESPDEEPPESEDEVYLIRRCVCGRVLNQVELEPSAGWSILASRCGDCLDKIPKKGRTVSFSYSPVEDSETEEFFD